MDKATTATHCTSRKTPDKAESKSVVENEDGSHNQVETENKDMISLHRKYIKWKMKN